MPSSADGDASSERTPLLGAGKPAINVTEESRSSDNEDARPDTNEDSSVLDEPTTRDIFMAMSCCYLGTFLAAVDSTVVATLSGTITASFDSLSLLSWLASAYFIANAALQPLAGKVTDIFGRRAGLIFSNVFFALGNLICGLAKSQEMMIFGRVIAGMGGGGLTAISTFVGSDLVPLRRRGVWQGIGNIAFGLGSALGGVYGGWINDTLGWRWAFLILVPFTVLSGILVFFFVRIPVKETEEARYKRLDFLGAFTLIATLVLLLFGLNSGGNTVPWTHPLVLTTIPLAGVLFLCFVWVEAKYAAEPIIPVRLMLDRTVASACLVNWFTTMANFGLIFYGPLYFQLRGYTATQAGIRLTPYSVGVALGSISTGIIIRSTGRYYWLHIFIQALLVLAFGLIATFTLETPAWPPFIYLFLIGLGYASMLTVCLLSLIAAVEHDFQAVITSASYAFRSTGSTIGITVSSSVFQNVLKSRLWSRLGDRPDAARIIPRVRDSLEEIRRLPEGWRAGVLDAYMDALRAVFLTITGIAVLGAVASLFMREHKLYNTLARRNS